MVVTGRKWGGVEKGEQGQVYGEGRFAFGW